MRTSADQVVRGGFQSDPDSSAAAIVASFDTGALALAAHRRTVATLRSCVTGVILWSATTSGHKRALLGTGDTGPHALCRSPALGHADAGVVLQVEQPRRRLVVAATGCHDDQRRPLLHR